MSASPGQGDHDVDVARWDTAHAARTSPTLARLTREFLTDCLPSNVMPTTVWPAWPIERLEEELQLLSGRTLLDIGCGRGDIGLRIAVDTGATLIGVDPSPVGLDIARDRAAEMLPPGRARFLEGHFLATGLADACGDAVLVADSLHFATDRQATIHELARVLRPGGRLVMTVPDRHDNPLVMSMFDAAGLDVLAKEETPSWRERMVRYHDALVAHQVELEDEIGAEQTADLVGPRLKEMTEVADHWLIVAEHKG